MVTRKNIKDIILPILKRQGVEKAALFGEGGELHELYGVVNDNPLYPLRFVTSVDLTKLDGIDFESEVLERILGEGVSREGTLLDVGEQTGILEKSGTWYLYGTERLGQGKDNAKTFLKGSPQIANAIEKAIREKAFSQNGHKEAEPQKELAGAKSGKAAKEK